MINRTKVKKLLLGVFAGAMLAPACAMADDAQTERLQHQIDALQRQLQSLQKQVSESKKVSREAPAQTASAPVAAPGTADGWRPSFKAPIAMPAGVKLTWGGFLAAEGVYRQHNAVADMGTPFTSIPYPFSPQYNEPEFRGSARQSRISLLVEGALDPAQKLAGYYEMDFLGAGITSNYNQSNSWAPRLRQGYLTYDNTDWGFHVLAGQSWSLLTQNTVGIVPRKENIPLTIDANYIAGFDYTRNWQIRVVKDFGSAVSLGLSIENPASQVYASAGAIANGGSLNGLIVNWANAGGSFLGSGAFANNFNTETAPDIIGKAAFDPGFGHYELFGLARFFTDSVFTCNPALVPASGVCPTSTANVGSASSHVTVGEGVGASALLPVVPKYLDLQGSVLYGNGIGRYGASQLSDVVVGSDGSLQTITALHALVGAIGHPWAGLDVYGYAGMEKADSKLFTSAAGVTGFGLTTLSNAGCDIVTGASFTGGTSNCAAVNKEVDMATVGFWQNLYKGDYGRVATGLQYEYIRRKSFDGVPGPVSTNDNVVLSSLRYYPFQ
ncbi:hypothetical protein [Bradyrhizobium sp.]|uniref:hypothetical protein n=1 Tax=Bradyrhizobium sp. TaxID=376 RepID=UPI003C6B7F54